MLLNPIFRIDQIDHLKKMDCIFWAVLLVVVLMQLWWLMIELLLRESDYLSCFGVLVIGHEFSYTINSGVVVLGINDQLVHDCS